MAIQRWSDPSTRRPILDVDGRLVRAQVEGVTARDTIDRLEARLRHRLERTAEHGEARRGELHEAGPHEWRHQSDSTHRPSYFPRPVDERRVIRRMSLTMAPCTVDEPALEMDLLDYGFHLFTEKGTGTASVLYRAGPTGYRLAQVAPAPADQLGPFELPVTISPAAGAVPHRRTSHQAGSACSACHSCSSSRPPRAAPACCITATTGTTG